MGSPVGAHRDASAGGVVSEPKPARKEPERARADRPLGMGAILSDGTANRWIAHDRDQRFVYLNTYPTPPGEIAIPIPWAVINSMQVCERS